MFVRSAMLLAAALLCLFVSAGLAQQGRTFAIDRHRNVFLKDGKPFRYISGEINYFRIHEADWEDRLLKARAMGVNALSIYVPWFLHQPTPERFDFTGSLNLERFLALAQRHEMFVLLRVGPYVCAELEFGGLPWWLNREPALELRTSAPRFLAPVRRYFGVLLPIVGRWLYRNGGPVLMVQIDNEYGSRKRHSGNSCEGFDRRYLEWLRDEVRGHLGEDTVLYTTDGNSDFFLSCGTIEGVYPTVDFGVQGSEAAVLQGFAAQRNYSGGGPPVNSEFYTTWFSGWGDRNPVVQDVDGTTRTLEWMWNANASFSFYMVHGGSNFGFLGGTEVGVAPVVQSYDYWAPISENGQITPLYEAIKAWIGRREEWPNKPFDVLHGHKRGVSVAGIPAVRLDLFDSVEDVIRVSGPKACLWGDLPRNIEHLDRDYALTLYSAVLDRSAKSIELPRFADQAYVFLDGVFQGNMSNTSLARHNRMDFAAAAGQQLDILVENIGRLVYPLSQLDPKGLLSTPLLDGAPFRGKWRMCGIGVDHLQKVAREKVSRGDIQREDGVDTKPAIYVSQFNVRDVDWSKSFAHFDARGWGHGILALNGFTVGRYWPAVGPQMTLFVPGAVMRNWDNFAVLVELGGRQQKVELNFAASPIWEFSEAL